MALSRHHVMHEATAWSSRDEAQRIRTTQSLIPRIDRDAHNHLHDVCPHVPLLGSYALRSVAQSFGNGGRNTLESIDLLMLSIEEAIRHPKAHLLEKQLGQLTIAALELQVPILREAVISDDHLTVVDMKPQLYLVK